MATFDERMIAKMMKLSDVDAEIDVSNVELKKLMDADTFIWRQLKNARADYRDACAFSDPLIDPDSDYQSGDPEVIARNIQLLENKIDNISIATAVIRKRILCLYKRFGELCPSK